MHKPKRWFESVIAQQSNYTCVDPRVCVYLHARVIDRGRVRAGYVHECGCGYPRASVRMCACNCWREIRFLEMRSVFGFPDR